jgi:hypothetical protein
MKKVIIPIYFHNNTTLRSKNCGIEYNIEDCDIRNVIIYNVNGVSECIENGKLLGTSIFFNGDEFISPLNKNKVEELIEYSETNSVIAYKELYIKDNKGEFINVT